MSTATVLNVDDHEPGRYARSRILLEAGYKVEEAATGFDTLAKISELRPALVLLDVHLPDMSGFEVCRLIRDNPLFAHIPILQISASAITDVQRVKGLNSGADAYLIEPVDDDVLLATVRALMRMRHAEQELHRVNSALQETNAALAKANAALVRSNEDLQRFSYLASHDMQEPLRTIRSFAALLDRRYRGKLDASADEYLNHIETAAARMSTLIRDLLTYAEAGEQVTPALTPVRVDAVINDAQANLEESLRECSAEIVRGPMPMIYADSGQLLQLFQNLIGNAIKYRSTSRSLVIHLSAEEVSPETWLFSVKDNGIGIAPEHTEAIFTPFKRLHGREVPGTGIGLATCRRIVERNGGRIWVESAGIGTGSTFKFTMRAAPTATHHSAN